MAQSKSAADLAISKRSKINIAEAMSLARGLGKSVGAQCKEMFVVARGFGKLSPQEYFLYRLYDDATVAPDEKPRFISDTIHHRVIRKCCDMHWWALADDKVIASTLLKAFGAPVPETHAVYHPGCRNFGPIPQLRTRDELARYLRSGARYPFFAKQIGGIASLGAWLVSRLDAAADALIFADAESIGVDAFASQVAEHADGYMFQDVLSPHPVLREACGDRVSTVRIVIIITAEGPEIVHAVWKIAAGGNIADNFWREGNMLAAVEVTTGTVLRCVSGVGPHQVEVANHPTTGRAIKGLRLPEWDRVTRLCLDCAGIFAKLRYQSYDIAICPQGPVIVEVNTGSSFLLPQVATGKGMLDDRFARFLQDCGIKRARA